MTNMSSPAKTTHIFPKGVVKSLSIDNLVFGLDNDQLKILLVRQTDPLHEGKWALPGGWIYDNEDLRDASSRLLEDLTGVKNLFLEQLKTFGRVDRFPGERVVTVAYYALVSAEDYSLVAGQTAEDVSWQSVDQLPELVYDHADILAEGLRVLRQRVRHQPIGFNLLPAKFTLRQLQSLYEILLNMKLDKPNFRRKILKMNFLAECDEKQGSVPHRAARLYRFDNDAYQRLTASGFSYKI